MLDVCLLGTGGMMPLPRRWLTALMCRYNGKNIKDLARAFEISEVQVRNIIRTSGKCIN